MALLCALLASVAVAVAGCGGSAKPAGVTTRALAAPDACSAAAVPVAAPSRVLSVGTTDTGLHGFPFGVAVTANGRWLFAAEEGGMGGIGVFTVTPSGPHLVRTIAIGGPAVGISLADRGRYLLVADGRDGAAVLSVARAETGAPQAVLGVLSEPVRARLGAGGAIEVTSSPDGHYAFVSLENGAQLAVYDLRAALADRFHATAYIGSVRVGLLPVGMAVSPDGRWLYATSEIAQGAHTGPGYRGSHGTLSVISIARAGRDPAGAVVATVSAHCSPVRVALSPDGSTVWVTARGDDQLLAFSAARLQSQPAHALLAAVRVGKAPVGVAVVHAGREIVVANSNRFDVSTARSNLTVVSAAAALAHRAAIIGTIPAGSFPRDMSAEPDGGTLVVGNFASRQLETVDVSKLP